MAQDAVSPSSQNVNLDDLEVDILILARNADGLAPAAAFLTRRGWPTTVIDNVSTAIEQIAEKQPDFVLISFNHPSPVLTKLPDLIAQTFNITCIGFLEKLEAASQSRLKSFKMRYKIPDVPSGPSLQRSIRKILVERFQPANGGGSNTESADTTVSSGMVTIQGEANASANGGMIQVSGAGSESQVVSNGKYTIQRQARTRLKQLAGASVQQAPTAGLLGELKKSLFGEKEGRESAGLPAAPVSDAGVAAPPTPIRKAMPASAPAAAVASTPASGVASSTTPPSATEDLTGLKRAVTEGFRRLRERPETLSPEPLGRLKKLAVFPVESETICPGYLVVGMAEGEKKLQDFFLRSCEAILREEMRAQQVSAELADGFWVEVPSVDFVQWTSAKAGFQLLISHQTSQIGVAYFPIERGLPQAPDANAHGMLPVAVDDISTEHPVTFKAYLHMAKNQKYFLYLRNGRRFQPEQKRRLKGKAVSNIFMKSVDGENLREFWAAAFLHDSIKKAS